MTSQGADRFTARLPVCMLQQVISIFVEDYKQRAKYIIFWRSIEFVDNHMSHMRAVQWTQTRKTGNLIRSRTLKTNVSHPHFDSLAAFYSIILFYYILNTSRSTGSVPVLKHSCLTVLLSLWMDVGAVAFLWPSVQGKHSPPTPPVVRQYRMFSLELPASDGSIAASPSVYSAVVPTAPK